MRHLPTRIPRYARLVRFYTPAPYVSHGVHPRVKKLIRKLEARATAGEAVKMDEPQTPDYKTWSQENLIERVTKLERELKNKNLGSI